MQNWRNTLYGKWQANQSVNLVHHITENNLVFEEVFSAFYSENGHIAHRCGFVLGQTFRKQPSLLLPKIEMLLSQMQRPPHQWYRWMTISYLSHCNFPEIHDGLAATVAFEELANSEAKPAVKNASMRLLEFICKRNPALIPEFRLFLTDIIANERPTLAAKAQKQLNTLVKIETENSNGTA